MLKLLDLSVKYAESGTSWRNFWLRRLAFEPWLVSYSDETKFDCLNYEIPCPVFGLQRPEGHSDEVLVAELERAASELLGP